MRRALQAIISRDLKRMLRQRGRLLSALVRPLIWLLVIGTGFQSMLAGDASMDYKQYLVPGVLGMALLFGALLSSLSMVYDKESGVMRMLVMAPFHHAWILMARMLSATLIGLIQAVILLLFLALFGYLRAPVNIPLLLLGLGMTSLVCAVVGSLIAVYSKNLEDFATIMNFVIFPMFFLSGALYPIQDLPAILKTAVLVNPFSYGVDLLKHALFQGRSLALDFPVILDVAVMAGFVAIGATVACLRFSNASVFESFARRLSAPKRG
jgi:ABC-2 type transport system permease protein